MANTLKFGGGNWATKKGSTLAYSDTNNAFKPLPFSFERNSIGTRVNKEGLIEVVGNDIPRIDYKDSTDGVLLLENSSTNLITYSEAFDNAYWNKSGVSETSGFISPDGTANAFKLVEDNLNSTHGIASTAIQTTSSLSYISYVFVKKSERNWVYFRTNIGSAFIYQWFDLTNKIAASSVGIFNDVGVIEYPNDWVMCYVKKTEASGSARQNQWFLSTDDLVQTYQGDGTSGLYIWGAMLEANSVASSYIPTNGSTVQRTAETCNGSGNSEVFNDSEGVLFANISALADGEGYRVISIEPATGTSNRIIIYYDILAGKIVGRVDAAGTPVFNYTATVQNQTNFNKIALKYKANDFALWINGIELGVDNTGNTPSGLNKLTFDNGLPADFFYGKTKEIGYYDTALTDEELEYMTSYRSLNEMVTELNLNAL